MNIQSGLKNFFGKKSFDSATFLMTTSIVGWLASSAAQVTALVINDKIPKKDKKFMVYQETMDAAVNIGLFTLFTHNFKAIGKNLVEKGVIVPKKLAEKLAKKPADKLKSEFVKDFYEANPAEKVDFGKFTNAVSTGVSLVGSIVASNVLTPYARNYIASKRTQGKNGEIKPSKLSLERQYVEKPVFHGNLSQNMENYLNDTRSKSSGIKI